MAPFWLSYITAPNIHIGVPKCDSNFGNPQFVYPDVHQKGGSRAGLRKDTLGLGLQPGREVGLELLKPEP